MKKLLMLILLALSVPAFLCAQSRVIDNAELLSAAERAELEKQLSATAATYGFDLVIVTEKDIGSVSAESYADSFYDQGGYGENGCLFLRVMSSREYYFSTSGRAIKMLNNTAYNRLESDVLEFLSNDPYSAFYAFINVWREFLALDAKGGRTYNFFHHWNALLVVIGWVVALLIGLGVVHVWKTQMNTALPQKQADLYVVPGSLAFTGKKDSFLYTKETKTKRESSSSSKGVGSRISSSGRSHGGRGGRR